MILQCKALTKLLQLSCRFFAGPRKCGSVLSPFPILYNKDFSASMSTWNINNKSQINDYHFIVSELNRQRCILTNYHKNKYNIFNYYLYNSRHYGTKVLLKDKFSLNNRRIRQYLKFVEEQFDLAARGSKTDNTINVMHMKPLVLEVKYYWKKEREMLELNSIIEENNDEDLIEMAIAEIKDIQTTMRQIEDNIMELIVTKEPIDETNVMVEVAAGVGGQEAMLFAADILNMYTNYAVFRGWKFELLQYDTSEQGGVRKASAIISGENVYKYLKYEGGVHRVQRVPKTERSGRIHTSTMTVSVLPQPTEIDVDINPQQDLKITTMRASGAGGQHVNKTNSAVRIVHIPTGLQVECQATRSQIRNREMALTILRSKLYERQMADRNQHQVSQKKLQVGSGGRSEKIRTYNFQQDRVTDHRIGESVGNIRGFLSGGEDLQELIDSLSDFADVENLIELLEQYEKHHSNKG